jgi:hypothetical protein
MSRTSQWDDQCDELLGDGRIDWSKWGTVRGTVRMASGEPAGHCGIWGEPTTLPADGMTARGPMTNSVGSYRLHLPAATYTINVQGTSPSGTTLTAEVSGVIITGGCDITVDITVMDDPD